MKAGIRELWSLEYEIEEIQTEFAKGIGSINIAELTDDFVEDVMLQSKPLQGILMAIRLRQKVSYSIIKLYYEKVNLWKYLVNINSGIKIDLKTTSCYDLQEAMEGVKAKYGEAIAALEPLKIVRPPKPAPAPPAPVAAAPEAAVEAPPAAAPAPVEAAA